MRREWRSEVAGGAVDGTVVAADILQVMVGKRAQVILGGGEIARPEGWLEGHETARAVGARTI